MPTRQLDTWSQPLKIDVAQKFESHLPLDSNWSCESGLYNYPRKVCQMRKKIAEKEVPSKETGDWQRERK